MSKEIIPFASKFYGGPTNIVFQQDSCGPHKAKSIKAFLAANDVQTKDWPAKSPDLNPIENARAILKRRLRRRAYYPKNAGDLFDILQHEWNSIPDSYFHDLVSSMPTRVQRVKVNRGSQRSTEELRKSLKISYDFLLLFASVHKQPRTLRNILEFVENTCTLSYSMMKYEHYCYVS